MTDIPTNMRLLTGTQGSDIAGAVFSDCGLYRYSLWRNWDDDLPLMHWVMLNPSTADHEYLDPTIKTCVRLAERDGYGGLFIYNIFALRSTNPRNLYNAKDPVGSNNDKLLQRIAKEVCDTQLYDASPAIMIAAWGTHGKLHDRGLEVMKLLESECVEVKCLGKTKEGYPRHPLYTRNDVKIIPYRGRS